MEKQPFAALEAVQRRTWAAGDIPGAPVLFYSGQVKGLAYWIARCTLWSARIAPRYRSRLLRRFGVRRWKLYEEGDRLRVAIPDVWALINAKMVATFSHVLRTGDFDYVFRTNSSSYVDRVGLLRWVENLPRTNCYGGSVHEWEGIPVASGSGLLLSRDLVNACVCDASWDFDVMDDLAIARSMWRRGIVPIHHPRVDAREPGELEPEHIQDIFHVRCKNRQDRSRDVETMLRASVLFNP